MSLPVVKNRLQRAPSARQNHQKEDEMPYVIRDFTVQKLDRPKISAPVLLATTNVHTFTALRLEEARRIRKVSSISSNSSHASSDTSSTRSRSTSITTNSSAGTSPQSSSPSSPQSTSEREKFTPPTKSSYTSAQVPKRSASTADVRSRASSVHQNNPLIPRRAPSHSKIAHENVARLRMQSWQDQSAQQPPLSKTSTASSITSSSILTNTPSTTASSSPPSSTDIFDFGSKSLPLPPPPPPPSSGPRHHPFGPELEQLDEAAEEFNGAVRDAEREQDNIVMSQRKLAKFSAADYLADLSPIFSRFFGPMLPARVVSKIPDGWI